MVYLITCVPTGKKYIGRKYFTKAKIQQKTKTKRKKKLRVVSDWVTYYGSSADLVADVDRLGAQHFTREVLRLCRTRGETNYYEVVEILGREALLRDDYYNKWCSLKLHRSSLKACQKPSTSLSTPSSSTTSTSS
jgi:hypothetical protein